MGYQFIDCVDASFLKPLDKRRMWDSLSSLQSNIERLLMPIGFEVYCRLENKYYQLSDKTTDESNPDTYVWEERKSGVEQTESTTLEGNKKIEITLGGTTVITIYDKDTDEPIYTQIGDVVIDGCKTTITTTTEIDEHGNTVETKKTVKEEPNKYTEETIITTTDSSGNILEEDKTTITGVTPNPSENGIGIKNVITQKIGEEKKEKINLISDGEEIDILNDDMYLTEPEVDDMFENLDW